MRYPPSKYNLLKREGAYIGTDWLDELTMLVEVITYARYPLWVRQ